MRVAATLLIIVIAYAAVSLLPVRQTESPPFALPAFQRVFSTDSSAASRAVDLWGSDPLAWRVEPYHGAPDDRRIVQYFERGRMELRSGSSRVVHGSLAAELVSGEIDLGDGMTVSDQPPEISIDSGELDDRVPTYLTLSRLAEQPAEDRSGERVDDWLDRAGVHQRGTTPAIIRYAEYVPATGHNLPDVTVDLFQRTEFGDDRRAEAFGDPISEPYWTFYRRDGELAPSLVQVFERRILVYTPGLAAEHRFTVASTGRHYYAWRYGHGASELPDSVDEAAPIDDVTTPNEFVATSYASDFGTPIDLALSPTGHPLILTQDGRILAPATRDPNQRPADLYVWADGIDGPLGIASAGSRVVVTTENGVEWYRQRRGIGERYEAVGYRSDLVPGSLPLGNPVVHPEGHLVAVTGEPATLMPLVETNPESPELVDGDAFAANGPIQFADSSLYLSGMDAAGRAEVGVLPAGSLEDSPGPPRVLASFPPGSVATALSVADIGGWRLSETGRVFVSVVDADDARIYAVPENPAEDANEAVEVLGGLEQPVAMMFGLDGSLYVADADLGLIVRLEAVD